MKKFLLALCILPLFCGCSNSDGETYELNTSNWSNYCSLNVDFPGISNEKPIFSITFNAKSPYHIEPTSYQYLPSVTGKVYGTLYTEKYTILLTLHFTGILYTDSNEMNCYGVGSVGSKTGMFSLSYSVVESITCRVSK